MSLWTVKVNKGVVKQQNNLPEAVKKSLAMLEKDLAEYGPVQGAWPNYSKLNKKRHHCHLKKGQPTYVAVWEVVDSQIRILKVTYVGTHENAPY